MGKRKARYHKGPGDDHPYRNIGDGVKKPGSDRTTGLNIDELCGGDDSIVVVDDDTVVEETKPAPVRKKLYVPKGWADSPVVGWGSPGDDIATAADVDGGRLRARKF